MKLTLFCSAEDRFSMSLSLVTNSCTVGEIFHEWIMVTNSCTVGEMQTTEEQEEAVL